MEVPLRTVLISEQAVESRAERVVIGRTMPYSLQSKAANSRRLSSIRNEPDLLTDSLLERSQSQPTEPSNLEDGITFISSDRPCVASGPSFLTPVAAGS